jgi:hypothetical protein
MKHRGQFQISHETLSGNWQCWISCLRLYLVCILSVFISYHYRAASPVSERLLLSVNLFISYFRRSSTEKRLGNGESDKHLTSSQQKPHLPRRLRTGQPRNRGSIIGKDRRLFLYSKVSRQALRSTQPPFRGEPGARLLGVKRSVEPTTT